MQCRELDELSSSRKELTPAQKNRLQILKSKTSTKFRQRKKQELGHEQLRNDERLHVRRNPPKNTKKVKATRKRNNKRRDANRRIKSNEKRLLGKKRGNMPYPKKLMTRFENACLEIFQQSQLKTAIWITLQKVFIAILETHWDRLPSQVTDDGRTPKEQKIKYRREQFRIASSKFLEPIIPIARTDDKWYKSEFRVKEEFKERISSIGNAALLSEIYKDIAKKGFAV